MRCCRGCQIVLAFGLLVAAAVHGSTNHHVLLITIDGFAAFYLEDNTAPLPTLRKLANEGATAAGMKVSYPSITWPNHTTLVTGVHPEKHSVLFNGVLLRDGAGQGVVVDPRKDKAELVATPTVYDILYKAGYRTAGVNWPCTRNSGTLHDDFPDAPEMISNSTPRLRNELVAAGVLKDETDRSFAPLSAAAKDQVWTAAAAHVIRTHKPNFMLFHMLITDGIQHKYGPRTPAAYTSLAQADAQLRDILKALDDAGIRERTTIFVAADHGFETATNTIHPNVLFRQNGLLETNLTAELPRRFQKARAQIISEGGSALVYFPNPETKQQDREKAIALLRAHPAIDQVIEPNEYAQLAVPNPEKNPQMGDLVITGKRGHAFSNLSMGDDVVTPVTLTAGTIGNHGYLPSETNMNAVFVVAGRGIKRGAKLGIVDNRDVAPTIAHLLGQKLSLADGKVLSEILSESR
jgi:predicted AlkP superfamily pyrophosphatase or phosphodiesterase